MAIKAGQILFDSHGFIIDRIQTGGVNNLNIPQEKVHELGNFQTVATIRDIPDLAFDLESLDVSTEIEALLVGKDPTTIVNGQGLSFDNSVPIDIISPFKSKMGAFDIVKGVVTPYLVLENVQYRFGVRANASETFGLRGDSVYYVPGSPYMEVKSLTPGTNQTYTFAHTAIVYVESGANNYALSACVKNTTTGLYKRLFLGTDYTNTSSGITLLADWQTAGYDVLHVTYGSAVAATYGQNLNADTSVKPAAVRSKDIDVYIGDGNATPVMTRWNGVINFDVQRRVNLDKEEEFGNTKYVNQDYDVATVTGSITARAADVADLFNKIAATSAVANNVVAGVWSSAPLQVELRVSDPTTGSRLKTIYIPDARFTQPDMQGRVQQKLQTQFKFESDGGLMTVYKGAKP